jgi:1,4-alpha-glucan branching enzyme
MLTKRKLAQGKVRVTFTMPELEGVKQLYLVGDFNNWSVTETPLAHAADGSWSVALTLAGGRKYEYRYYADGQVWHNDWAADAYAPNTFGTENSVVDLAGEGEKAARPATTSKSPAPKKNTSKKKAAKA